MSRRLIHKEDGRIVNVGDKVKDFRGLECEVTGWQEPTHSGSTGRVNVKQQRGTTVHHNQYYPGVFGLEWVETGE